MWYAEWFKTLKEAKKCQKEKGGVLYKNEPRSRSKKDHLIVAQACGFDPDQYPYSVNRII